MTPVFSEIANAEQDEDIDLTDPIFDKITDDIASARPSVPVPDPELPSTGGTGGTGGSGSEGGGSA
ncbi:hypothetical protein P4S64_22990 [Vibrio sp. M60_M31a]